MYTSFMDNIIKTLRERAGLSQVELSNLSGVTRRYIISLEKNIPKTVPDGVLLVLSEVADVPPDYVLDSYQSGFNGKTKEIYDRLKPRYEGTVRFFGSLADLRHDISKILELNVSQIKFCELFAVNPAALSAYELGRMRSMPKSIQNVLKSLGFTDQAVNDIHKYTVG